MSELDTSVLKNNSSNGMFQGQGISILGTNGGSSGNQGLNLGAGTGVDTSQAALLKDANSIKVNDQLKMQNTSLASSGNKAEEYFAAIQQTGDFMQKIGEWAKTNDRPLNEIIGYANGGSLGTHGADFPPLLREINEGGSHEQNPLGGVQQGIDPQGVPNLVEEGETVYDNYVFSKRLTVPKEIRDKYKLGKKEISFADASKKLGKEAEERPNDVISKRGLDANMKVLADTQEQVREEKQQKEALQQLAQMSPEEQQMMFAQMQQEQMQNQQPQEEQGYQLPQDMASIQPMYARGGRLCNTFEDKGQMHNKWDISSLISTNNQGTEYHNSITGKKSPYADLDEESVKALRAKIPNYDDWTAYAPTLPESDPYWQWLIPHLNEGRDNPVTYDQVSKNFGNWRNDAYAGWATMTPTYIEAPKQSASSKVDPSKPTNVVQPQNTNTPQSNPQSNPLTYNPRDERLMYAPVAGAGLALLDAMSPADYSNADALAGEAYRAGDYKGVSFNPIGDFLTYKPMDRLFAANEMRASAAAQRSAIINNSSMNRGQAIAGLLAQGYNENKNFGQLFRQAEEYNMANRERVANFNRDTHKFNSEGFMKAAMANQSADAQARARRLQGVTSALTMREQIGQARANAIAAARNNLFDNLGNIGIYNANRNDRDKLIVSNAFGTLPKYWTSDLGLTNNKAKGTTKGNNKTTKTKRQ